MGKYKIYFSVSYSFLYNPGKRQLHLLSIVDYPNFSMLTTLSSFISPSNTPKSFWILQSKIDGMWKFGL